MRARVACTPRFRRLPPVTGRLASNDPNLQNIPVRTAEGRRIREAFIAPPDHVLVSADYSQIELRIMAHLSEDPALLRAFHEGQDIHRATAGDIFGVKPEDVTTDQRRYIKAVNFGLIYGMGAFGLAQQLGIERGAAQQFHRQIFRALSRRCRIHAADAGDRARPGLRRNGVRPQVVVARYQGGWGPSPGGRRTRGDQRADAGHGGGSHQAGDDRRAGWLDRESLATRLLLQVHDELVLEVPAAEVGRVQRELPGLMNSVASLRVPLVVDVGTGANWDQAH
jgi:DNA polymerase-1